MPEGTEELKKIGSMGREVADHFAALVRDTDWSTRYEKLRGYLAEEVARIRALLPMLEQQDDAISVIVTGILDSNLATAELSLFFLEELNQQFLNQAKIRD